MPPLFLLLLVQAYRLQTAMFDGREYRWGGTTARWANASRNSSTDGGFIEFVTSPNNPDAMLREPALRGSSAAIFDHAYYWPHFTHIPAPADEDVMLFTISKPSGHAGSRFGWALIRDEKVAKRALDYVSDSIMGASRDTQLRMLGIVKAMLASLHGEDDIFAFGHDVLRSRWRRLNAAVSRSRRISLQKIAPGNCTYFKRIREPSPAYAWVRCERKEDEDCHDALLKANIITRAGVGFEAGSRYTRISLLKSDDDFDVLMERVTDLVDAEKKDDAAPGSSSM
jgi:aspartate/methionine/tyrosine aminotransferase